MKALKATLVAIIAIAAATSLALAQPRSAMAVSEDVDPTIDLAPGESIVLNGEIVTNDGPNGITVVLCPGKGEACSISYDKWTYAEEKDENKPPFEIRW